MKIIELMLACMLSIMSLFMLIVTILTPSPIKIVGITLMTAMFLVTMLGVVMLYKENKKESK